MMRALFFSFLLILIVSVSNAATIKGRVSQQNTPLSFTEIFLDYHDSHTLTDSNGYYFIEKVPIGTHRIKVQTHTYESEWQVITITSDQDTITHHFDLTHEAVALDNVVITGRKTFQRDTKTPTIINMMNTEMLNNLQSCNLAEGLKFQPGLRVETDCQTCNYTQLRMNGLQGSYAQILINGRPIVSPMMMLYGLEQLPVNMIERLEVIRGAGNSIYGAAAIGGTINVITKLPKYSGYELNTTQQFVGQGTSDFLANANGVWVHKNQKLGLTTFANYRQRGYYDANDDHFSELPKLKNTGVGITGFYLPTTRQKIECSISFLDEYRTGGDMMQSTPHLAQQNEERKHRLLMANVDYQYNINPDIAQVIAYAAISTADRQHFTGVLPDSPSDIIAYQSLPPYGKARSITQQVGVQYHHKFKEFLGGTNTFTLGVEYLSDKVNDAIPTYHFFINQHTKNLVAFLQSQWTITPKWTLTSGLRMDKHNLIAQPIFNPRIAILYAPQPMTQFRMSYGKGFRAPQAFDTDMHLAFAGGGISRVLIDSQLTHERSQSITASFNYDRSSALMVYGCTVEGFYTKLDDVFALNSIGTDSIGEVFFKTNAQSAIVRGVTLELRANYDRKWQLESGFTIQRSQYASPIVYIENEHSGRDFLRTPNQYGFASLTWTPDKRWTVNLNAVYTGRMIITRFGGSPLYTQNDLIQTPHFTELNTRVSYRHHIHTIEHDVELYAGVKNILNAYQSDFDIGKNRDSNYIYGPSAPRTVFIGLRWEYNKK